MKRIIPAFFWIILVCAAGSASALAADESFLREDAFTKLGRGLSNIVTGPGELYIQPVLMATQYEPAQALFGGIGKGLAMLLVREAVGAYELVTFPIPFPKKYKAVLEPATPFTNWDTRKP
jgi:putative exosortase-associated protein (TIGR04073 family)